MSLTDQLRNLTKANTARMNKALDREYRFSHGADTFRNMIEKGFFSHSFVEEVPKITYNRRKWNRLNHEGQQAYQKQLDLKKTEYALCRGEGSELHIVVPKMIYDYFNSLNHF